VRTASEESKRLAVDVLGDVEDDDAPLDAPHPFVHSPRSVHCFDELVDRLPRR